MAIMTVPTPPDPRKEEKASVPMINRAMLLAPGHYFIPMRGRKRCPDCNALYGAEIQVNTDGFSAGSGFQHKLTCPALRCEHGVVWNDECADCEAARLAAGTDDTCGPCCSGVHENCEASGCICSCQDEVAR